MVRRRRSPGGGGGKAVEVTIAKGAQLGGVEGQC
jgi:hypothetical protein